jgi:hypothetical protein
MNLAVMVGMSEERAKEAISTNCGIVIENAGRWYACTARRDYNKHW